MEISASKFKARCLELMDRVDEFGEEILITKRGRPVAKLGPVAGRRVRARSSFGCMSKKGRIHADLEAAVEVEWDAMKGILLHEWNPPVIGHPYLALVAPGASEASVLSDPSGYSGSGKGPSPASLQHFHLGGNPSS